MNSFLSIFNIVLFLQISTINFSAHGQILSPEYPQEKDWQNHYLFNQKLDQTRREGLLEVRKKRVEIEKQHKSVLEDYKKNRSKASTESQVGSKEWMAHVKESLRAMDERAKQDAQYIQSKKTKINSAAERKYHELVAREFDIKISDHRRGGLVKQGLPGSSGSGSSGGSLGGGGSGYSSGGGAHSFDGGGSIGNRGDFAPNNSPNGVPGQRRNPAPMDEMDDDMPDLAMPPPNMEDEPPPMMEQPPPLGF